MKYLYAAVALVVLVVGGYFIYRAVKNRDSDKSVPNTAQDIRNTFGAGSSTPPSTAVTPAPSFAPTPNPQTPPPVVGLPAPAPVSPRGRQASPQRAQPLIYRNQGEGFEFTVPEDWLSQDQVAENKILFFKNTGAMAGYAEIYPADGASLESLRYILQNSPSVKSVTSTSLDGISAIKFLAQNSIASGIALIYNGKIYYLRGALANVNLRFI